MKKFFVVMFVLVMAFASISVGQSNSQIANTSNEISKINNLDNPNLIFPRQGLLLPIPGVDHPMYYDVINGDNLWFISKRLWSGDFDPMPKQVNVDPINPEKVEETPPMIKGGFLAFLASIPFWVIVLLLLALVSLILYAIFVGRNWRNSDPVTSGPAQIPGGIQDRDVSAVVTSRYPNCRILSITKGRLYGHGVAHYNFSRLSVNSILNDVFGKNFNGEVGYQARVINPEGQEILVQTLMGCGNEIRMNGQFLTGLTFIPDGEQPEVLRQPEVSEPTTSAKEEKIETAEKQSADSELFRTISSHAMLAEEFLKTQTAHKVTLKVTTPQGTVETVLEAKIESKQTDKKTNEEGTKK